MDMQFSSSTRLSRKCRGVSMARNELLRGVRHFMLRCCLQEDRSVQHMENVLGLVMIVRDEAEAIAQTLHSIKDSIDFWTIVDTGSTDGTPAIVNATLRGVPGQHLSTSIHGLDL
jgi:hypothetical protein